MSKKPRVLLVCGYFDWFSGYQETALARGFEAFADVQVLAGDRVNPIFSDGHLESIGMPRRYGSGTVREHGITVHRVKTVEIRSMLFARGVRKATRDARPDLIVQVMPGQFLPALASPGAEAPRAVLYGDNSAMWTKLSPAQQRLKWSVFAATKGQLYRGVNRNAALAYGYTPETTVRLDPFAPRGMSVLPLAYREDVFYFDPALRREARDEYQIESDEVAVLVAGKVQPQKRTDVVAAAVSRLASSGRRVRLLVAGNDDSQSTKELLASLASLPGMEGRLTATGFLSPEALNRAFNAADIGVWPAMPAITIQQAMGTGLSVVLPRNEYVGHLLRPGTGFYMEPQYDPVDAIESCIPRAPEDESARAARAQTNGWLSSFEIARSIALRAGILGN